MKLSLLKQHKKALTNTEIIEVVSTIYGNDVNLDSVIITELRLLLCVAEHCGIDHCRGLGKIMNRRFSTYDFVGTKVQAKVKHHIMNCRMKSSTNSVWRLFPFQGRRLRESIFRERRPRPQILTSRSMKPLTLPFFAVELSV